MRINYSQMLFKILPFAVLIFLGLGCQMMETVESTKIPQSEITQHYVVVAERKQTRVTAYFNQGSWGKSVDLDVPSKIENNDSEMTQSSVTFLQGTVYFKNFNGVEKNHKFVYTNNDGKVFQNEMSFEPIEIASEQIVINRLQETAIPLSRAVGKDENVKILLKSLKPRPDLENSNIANANQANTPDYDLDLNDELNQNRSTIILKPKNLKKFVSGKAILTVEISREFSLQQQNPTGGAMRYEYISTADANVIN